MAGIYDVHMHLNDELYEENHIEPSEIVAQSKATGVDILNVVGINVKTSKIAIRQATQFANVYAVVGIHPNEADLSHKNDLDEIYNIANSKTVVAIGEIGLDYSRNGCNKNAQKNLFTKQLQIAKKNNLPAMIHIKDRKGSFEAYEVVLEILKTVNLKKVIIHGYEGNEEYAKKFLKENYLLSFNGKITYGLKELEDVVKSISLNQMMIESDSPYFSPVPYQKEINYPVSTNLIAKKIAELKKIDVDEVISATRTNGQKFFEINN